ncbi:hypothetical protein Tco_0389172 [Tanacetum coccineum]
MIHGLRLDIDDSDLNLTPVLRSSSSARVEPSPYTPNPVRIIPGPAGTVQVSSSTCFEPSSSTPNPVRIIPGPAGLVQRAKQLKENVFILDPDGALMSTQEYMTEVVEVCGVRMLILIVGKLKQVVAIVKSCSPNCLGDLNVTMKDLSGIGRGTVHHKVLDVGTYGKDIHVGAAMVLANVSVFTPKPSEHYVNITKKNVVKVFRNSRHRWMLTLIDVHRLNDRVLAPVVRSSSSARVEPSPYTPNLVTIIPGPAGLVQRAKQLKENVFILDPDGALMSTQEYMQKVVEDVGEDSDFNNGAWINATNYVLSTGGTVIGCLGDIDNFLEKGKLAQVVTIVKTSSLNALGDLNVTIKDLSGTVRETVHYKVLDVGTYGKDIHVGAAMILAKVSVFTPRPSEHYLNITKKNVVKVFCKDTVSLA